MKIIGCYDSASGAKHFKLLHRPRGIQHKATLPPNAWRVVDDDYSLLRLLTRNKMLVLDKGELIWARHRLRLMREAKDVTTLDYCLTQANLVSRYGDDPLYRIATRLFVDERKFAYYDKYGLNSDVRRLTLAFVITLGVEIE